MLLSFSHPGVYAWVITTKLGILYGIRTRANNLKGCRPRPLDEQDKNFGAVDGTRTRLNLIDNQVPFPEDYYGIFLAEGTGIEPVITESKSVVLPLH